LARQVLDLTRPDEDDEFSDLSEEEPLTYLNPYSEGARPAPLCDCPDALGDDGLCHRCGRTLPDSTSAQHEPVPQT
jgi:hypothetical protein